MSITNTNMSLKINNISTMSWDSFRVNVAPRPYHAFVFRTTGFAVFHSQNTVFKASPNDVCYIPAGCPYIADYTERNEIIAIHFLSDDTAPFEIITPSSPAIIQGLFEKACKAWSEKPQGYYYLCTALLCEILSKLPDQKNESIRKSSLYGSFFETCEYINSCFTDTELSISSLAEKAGMSQTYFRRLFLQTYGIPPLTHIKNLRLNRAEELLSTGKHTITEVALLSGFSDPKYFSRVIREKYGCSPSALFSHTQSKPL